MKRTDAIKIRHMIDRAAALLPDNAAAECPDLFPTFDAVLGQKLPAGFKLQDGGILYAVIQEHTTQADWRPAAAPALFKVVPKDGEIREITDPIPAENPFMKGEKGRWKGEVYVSQIDNNVWTPDAYPAGWTLA